MLFRLIKIDRQILKEEESRQLINKINIFLRKWWKHLSIKWSMLPSCGNLSMRVTPPCPPCSLPLPGCLLFRLSVGSISQFREIVPFYGWASPDPLWQSVGASVPGCLVSCRDSKTALSVEISWFLVCAETLSPLRASRSSQWRQDFINGFAAEIWGQVHNADSPAQDTWKACWCSHWFWARATRLDWRKVWSRRNLLAWRCFAATRWVLSYRVVGHWVLRLRRNCLPERLMRL